MAITQYITNIADSVSLPIESRHTEKAFGHQEGMRTALWDIRDRTEFIRLLAALGRSRAAFLIELRTTQFVIEGGVASMPLDEFADLMFGPGAGGVHGDYASGFLSSFAVIAPFVASTH